MCVVSSGTWRRNSGSGARTVPCTIPNAALMKRRSSRRSSNANSPGSHGYVEEEVVTGVIEIDRIYRPRHVPTSTTRSGGEEFVLGSAISPEDDEIEEFSPSESSEEAIESQPEMEIASLAIESQSDELSPLEEPTIDSSFTSLETEALSSEDGEEALPSDYAEEEAYPSEHTEEALPSDYAEEEAYPSEYTEEALPSDYAEEEAYPSEYTEEEETYSSEYTGEALPSEYAEEEAIESAYEEELAMASDYGMEAMASSASLASRGRRVNIGEDDDLEEYTAKTLDEGFPDWESTPTSLKISTKQPGASSSATQSASAPAADMEEDSIPSSPASTVTTYEGMPQESMPSQTKDEEFEALECTGSAEMPPEDKEDLSVLWQETTAPPSSSEDEDDSDLADEEAASIAVPSSAEAWDRVPMTLSSPSTIMETVMSELTDVAEGVGHIEDPLPATSIETEDKHLALPLDMEGFGTLPDTECIQRLKGPLDNVPCQTNQTKLPKELPTIETEPCDETEEGDTDTEKQEGSALFSPPIAEGEAQQDPTQEPAPASEPAPARLPFCHRTYRPQISKATKLSKRKKTFIEHEAREGAETSKKTKPTPHFPQSSPSATAAEADRERSMGPAVTYPKHKSPVYQTRRRSGQQQSGPSDAGTYVTSGMSHLDRAWAQKDYSKPDKTETGQIRFGRDEIRRYGRWKPAETQFTTHQPYRFQAETTSTNKCIVYRRIPCGKSHTSSHSFLTVAIGKPNISRNACRARGCCWLEISKHYWKRGCFQPRS